MSLVPDYAVATIAFIGFLGYVVAFVYASRNYRDTMSIGVTWLMFQLSMANFAAYAFVVSLRLYGFYPSILEDAAQPIFAVSVFALAAFTIISATQPVQPE